MWMVWMEEEYLAKEISRTRLSIAEILILAHLLHGLGMMKSKGRSFVGSHYNNGRLNARKYMLAYGGALLGRG